VKDKLNKKVFYILVVGEILAFALLIFAWAGGHLGDIDAGGLGPASRMTNGMFAALLTVMTLIITLTSNLYTPYLLDVFIHNPFNVFGLGIVLASNVILVVVPFYTTGEATHTLLVELSLIFNCINIGGIIPFFYYMAQFVKPSFFLPRLQNNAIAALLSIHRSETVNKQKKQDVFFKIIDIMSNIASTASKREDKELVILVFKAIHQILMSILKNYELERKEWRVERPVFENGLSKEGKFFLAQNKSWPECYIFRKILKMYSYENVDSTDITPLVCENLLESLDVCITDQRENLVEFHIMIFNSIFRRSIDELKTANFQLVSYYYRVLIEHLKENEIHTDLVVSSFFHYGTLAKNSRMPSCKETSLFDLGHIILFMSYDDEDMAISYIDKKLKSYIKNELQMIDTSRISMRIALVKTYLELKSKHFDDIADYIEEQFLKDVNDCKNEIDKLLKQRRILHWEFNDRLINYSYLSAPAQGLAMTILKAA
jgi:hypothetical protein